MPKTLFCLDDGYLALVVVVLEHSIIIYIKQFVLFAVRDIDLARILSFQLDLGFMRNKVRLELYKFTMDTDVRIIPFVGYSHVLDTPIKADVGIGQNTCTGQLINRHMFNAHSPSSELRSPQARVCIKS